MQLPGVIRELARGSSHPAVISHLLSRADLQLAAALATNEHLTLKQRRQLLALAKCDPESEPGILSALASSAYGDGQIAQLLGYSRQSARYFLFMYGLRGASDALIERVIKKLSRSHAAEWLDSPNPPTDKYLLAVAKIENSATLLNLAADLTYTHEQVLEILNTVDLTPISTNYVPFIALIDHRPALIPAYIELAKAKLSPRIRRDTIFDALATCRHIFDQVTFQNLIYYSRTLSPSERRTFLETLAHNPNVGPQVLWDIRRIIKRSRAKSAPALLNTIERLYTQKSDHPELTITTDWSEVVDPAQLAVLQSYMDAPYAGGYRYPTYYRPRISPPNHYPPSKGEEVRSADLSRYYLDISAVVEIVDTHSPLIMTAYEFQKLILPELLKLGDPALATFLDLSYGWQASADQLLETTKASYLT